nr:TRC40/GET3/ArsA family transport-energizing ATPase [uncultured Desulfobacter sp.]
MTVKILFFLGKGGTGKSTASALVSLVLMQKGKKVLLASFDDAHNQGDIFQETFTDKACTMGPCLEVLQVDRDKEIQAYLSKTADRVKASYTYLTAFNLDNYFDILKFSPGMEEYALVTAFMGLWGRYNTYDYLVIDMPPTALSMRFFNLPALSLTWVEHLEKLRKEINDRKEIVSRIKFAGKAFERDRILKRIHEIKADYLHLNTIFNDPAQASFYAVVNEDRLSVAETGRIIEQLAGLSISLKAVICNNRGTTTGTGDQPFEGHFPSLPVEKIPFSESPLIGMDALEAHIRAHDLRFDRLV